VGLDPEQHDAHGLPVARISSVLTEQSVTRLRQMAKAARAVLAEAGAMLVEEASSRDSFTATHVFGTARMGTDRTTSVADPMGRTHDHPNLWITDASTFPSSGGGEAPSLTIMALALRAADAIASQ
jgi:choline dehydrogenase-like flavoprotein